VTEDDVELVPGAIGAFEIIVDGEKKYSKLQTGRFPDDATVTGMV
jgi:selT/selW/selH-like putative selenoprotein